jgi:NAD(P)-dependent dehydrogenase (short-subunit alcohol dehydrogenase family)
MKLDLFSLTNKVVVITGAVGLLGQQHADAVATFGGIPVLLDLQSESVEKQAAELNDTYGVEAVGYSVDITKEDQIHKNCKKILERFGHIDALINNAANNPKVENTVVKNFSRLENFPLDVWQVDLAVGLTGAFLCAKHYGTAISRNTKGGVILNISSDLGLIAPDQRLYRQPGLPEEQQQVKPVTYSVVKTGLIGLTHYLATYWPTKVRCNALCPGGVEAGQPEDFIKEVTARIPIGRMAQVDEYQGAIVFLLSAASAYMNGAVVPVEGGRTVL